MIKQLIYVIMIITIMIIIMEIYAASKLSKYMIALGTNDLLIQTRLGERTAWSFMVYVRWFYIVIKKFTHENEKKNTNR